MPTIWTQAGFTFVIFLNDHEPAHVHVFSGHPVRGTPSLKMRLQRGRVSPERIPRSWTNAMVRRAIRIGVERYEQFLAEWRQYHE